MLRKSDIGRGWPIERFGARVRDSGSIRATKGLEVFPPEGAEEVRRSDFWLNAGGFGANAGFTEFLAVIVNHQRVI